MQTPPVPEFRTFVELLRHRAESQPEYPVYTFLLDGEKDEAVLSHRELDRRARTVAASLQAVGVPRSRPVLLLFPPGLDFIAAFFGCLYAGLAAVPSYPPNPSRRTRTHARLAAVVENAHPGAVLTTSDLLPAVGPLYEAAGAALPPVLAVDALCAESLGEAVAGRWTDPGVEGDTLAVLQYTSGSTGSPGGVMLSHHNLLYNSELIRILFGNSARSHGLAWLPPYHDMGLIGGILQPLYVGATMTLLSPLHFLQRPARWLRAISRTRATCSGAPNFAFDLCVEKTTREECEGLDLSRWKVAFTGAEPVRADTLRRFAEAFAPCGFRLESFYPCYGLAEATLIVSGGAAAAAPVTSWVDAAHLRNDEIVPAAASAPGAVELVSCGPAAPGLEVAIVDPATGTRRAAGEVGEVWVRGPSVARGYWNRPDRSEATFRATLEDHGPYLRTGDLGFVQGGELFVTGRLKDLIILDGQNHYPQDIELTAEQSHLAIRPGGCVAFSADRDGREQLVVVAEIDRSHLRNAPELPLVGRAIRRAVSERHDVRVADVVLVRPASVPKTPSGKPQRRGCREAFLNGELQEGIVLHV